jgi:hypothetical protein
MHLATKVVTKAMRIPMLNGERSAAMHCMTRNRNTMLSTNTIFGV